MAMCWTSIASAECRPHSCIPLVSRMAGVWFSFVWLPSTGLHRPPMHANKRKNTLRSSLPAPPLHSVTNLGPPLLSSDRPSSGESQGSSPRVPVVKSNAQALQRSSTASIPSKTMSIPQILKECSGLGRDWATKVTHHTLLLWEMNSAHDICFHSVCFVVCQKLPM